jgi:arylformamidase
MFTWLHDIKNALLEITNSFYILLTKAKPRDNSVIYDLTRPITTSTPVFPGDPAFRIEQVQSLESGSSYNLCCLHLGNHMGTHIDFPAHVIKGGKTSSDYPINHLIGAGVVIEVPKSEGDDTQLGITQQFIQTQSIYAGDIVFFKTSNSKLPTNKISEQFVYLTKNGADELIKKQVKIVGIDYLSIDSLSEEKLPVHNQLLSNDILIVENLDLEHVPAGRYQEISIIPPNIVEMDGLPVRAFARR